MNHFESLLLLADLREVIGSLVGLLLLVLWVIGQLTEGKKQAGRQAAQRPAPPAVPQRPDAAQGAAGQAGAAQAAAKPPVGREAGAERHAARGIRGEMEEFLRRAAAQKGGAQPAAGNRAARPGRSQLPKADRVEVLVDERGRAAEGRGLTDRLRPKGERPPVAPRTVTAKGAGSAAPRQRLAARRESVAEHVQQHVAASTRAMAEQASHLGQRIVADDAAFDIQLKAKFDHGVGTLASAVRVTDTPSQSPDHRDASSPAGQLAALLASSDGIRQAIIINEILRRPSERW